MIKTTAHLRSIVLWSLIFLFTHSIAFAEKKVILRVLDKITGHVSLVHTALNQESKFGSLTFKVKNAAKSAPEERPEVYAYITIWDNFTQDGSSREIFKNWMFSSSPGLSALDHPLYDVWVIDYK